MPFPIIFLCRNATSPLRLCSNTASHLCSEDMLHPSIPSPPFCSPVPSFHSQAFGQSCPYFHLFNWSWSIFRTCHSTETTSVAKSNENLLVFNSPALSQVLTLLPTPAPANTLCPAFSLARPWSSAHPTVCECRSPTGLLSRFSQELQPQLGFPTSTTNLAWQTWNHHLTLIYWITDLDKTAKPSTLLSAP